MWCIGAFTPEYRERMYDLLDLYEKTYDPKRPKICLDEKSKQLLGETREHITGRAGRCMLYDYEYTRNGTRNIFMAVEPMAGKRIVMVTKQRKAKDFVRFIKKLIKEYPHAEKLCIVLDNLNTHFEKSFYDNLSYRSAKRILSKLEFHYTPKHASWLNMAEIEIGIMDRQCLKGRIGDEKTLINSICAWQNRRNKQKKKIIWTFTKQDADEKLRKYYV